MKNNISPFYVGQLVEVVCGLPPLLNVGDRFRVLSVEKMCCEYNIDIGICVNLGSYCRKCKTILSTGRNLFAADRFRAIVNDMQTISYSKILEEIPMGVN